MWSKIDSESDIIDFMRIVNDLSDSCIKEIKYVSGGYVSENLGMHAVNTKRNLYIYIQSQYSKISAIELLFEGVKKFYMLPRDEQHDCVIYDSSIIKHQNLFYWADYGDLDINNVDKFGTFVEAEQMYWRSIDFGLGETDVYANCIK